MDFKISIPSAYDIGRASSISKADNNPPSYLSAYAMFKIHPKLAIPLTDFAMVVTPSRYSTPFWTKTPFDDQMYNSSYFSYPYATNISVLPTLKPSESLYKDLFLEGNFSESIPTVQFGTYPQNYVTDVALWTELNEAYQARTLPKTGNQYTFYRNEALGNYKTGRLCTYESFTWEDRQFLFLPSLRETFAITYDILVLPNQPIWIEILPVEWKIDTKHQVLVASKVLLSGIPLHNDDWYSGDFEDSFLYGYLNHHFKKQLLFSSTPVSSLVDTHEDLNKLMYKKFGKR